MLTSYNVHYTSLTSYIPLPSPRISHFPHLVYPTSLTSYISLPSPRIFHFPHLVYLTSLTSYIPLLSPRVSHFPHLVYLTSLTSYISLPSPRISHFPHLVYLTSLTSYISCSAPLISSLAGVRSECENSCAAYPCQNGGNCRQLENQFDCLCSGTFFKGKTCSEDMALVRFTAGSTLRYTFYEHKTTIKDDLHIKFKTTNTDGGLVQVQTEDPNQFIKLEIKDSVGFMIIPSVNNLFVC